MFRILTWDWRKILTDHQWIDQKKWTVDFQQWTITYSNITIYCKINIYIDRVSNIYIYILYSKFIENYKPNIDESKKIDDRFLGEL